jgi:hypothetical protein
MAGRKTQQEEVDHIGGLMNDYDLCEHNTIGDLMDALEDDDDE